MEKVNSDSANCNILLILLLLLLGNNVIKFVFNVMLKPQ